MVVHDGELFTALPCEGEQATDSRVGAHVDRQRPDYLTVLSQAQYAAVTAPAEEPLQILAGPGSGKTRVLVSRVAWLVLEKNVDPRDLVVVTFTNKAAREMRVRLTKLIGQHRVNLLIIGTFHATCAKFLRQHARLVGIGSNFSICDADESKKIIKAILKDVQSTNKTTGIVGDLRPEVCIAEISRAKAKNQDVDAYIASLQQIETEAALRGRRQTPTAIRRTVAAVFQRYTEHLQMHNALDFDDLLVFGVRLLSTHARVIANVQHVLVDEFQDTNVIQYELMACFAGKTGARGAVTIVGDPDQSIYGWRAAEVGNLDRMANEFAIWSHNRRVLRVFLEENYRSTGHILQAAKGIIESSSTRIERGLFTSHAKGPNVVLQQFSSSQMEATFIATEIKRLVAHAGGLFTLDDFAILLRFNALSREVEQQLLRENIPSRIMGGARFFERREVKDVLAYLILADNPRFMPALDRVINVPKRAIGEGSIKSLHELAKQQNRSTMDVIEDLVRSDRPSMGVKPSIHKGLCAFMDVLHHIRLMAVAQAPVSEIIKKLLERSGYEAYLRKEPDFEQRWENVKELINFSTMIALEVQSAAQGVDVEDGALSLIGKIRSSGSYTSSPLKSTQTTQRGTSSQNAIDLCSSDDEEASMQVSPTASKKGRKAKVEQEEVPSVSVKKDVEQELIPSDEQKSALRTFLEACTLSTDMEAKEQDPQQYVPKVTIATAHAAKGLEFPVVFVISVEDDTYPFYRSKDSSEEIDEEARLLYVAVTRAQTQAYLTHCAVRFVSGQEKTKILSPFVARIADAEIFSQGKWKEGEQTDVGEGRADGVSGANPSKPPAEKVDFGVGRPKISEAECQLFAAVLGRPAPLKADIDQMIKTFRESETATRAMRVDIDAKSNTLTNFNEASTYGSHMGPQRGGSTSSLFAVRELSPPSKYEGSEIRPAKSLIARINERSNYKSQSLISSSYRAAHNDVKPFSSSPGQFQRPHQTSAFGTFGERESTALRSLPTAFSSRSNVSEGPARSTLSHGGNRLHPSSHAKRLGPGRGPMTYPKKPKNE